MTHKRVLKLLISLIALSVDTNHCQISNDLTAFSLNDVHIRHAHLRCLQQFPQAEIVNYTETSETKCFLHCFLYKAGLMDLKTRSLDSKKIFDIWEKIEAEAFVEDNCFEQFYLNEPLNGSCSDSYRMLMKFRNNCLELFEFIFSKTSTWKTENANHSKAIGQSATEFCDFIDEKDVDKRENSQIDEISLLALYKEKLKCIFDNIHYLDGYGRVDESEIILSYQEAQEDSSESRAAVHTCSHRANAKFQQDYIGNLVLELQKCLKDESAVFARVFKIRDENSRQY